MTEPLRPAAVGLFGKKNWIFVTTLASAVYVPTAAEVVAGSSLDISRILFADSTEPTQNTNVVDQERRYADTLLFQFIGQTTYGGGQMHYAFNPQGAAASDGVKAFEKFTAGGTTGFLVKRLGIARATTPVTGQFVNAFPIQIGPSFDLPAGDNESEEAGMAAMFVITDTPAIHVALT